MTATTKRKSSHSKRKPPRTRSGRLEPKTVRKLHKLLESGQPTALHWAVPAERSVSPILDQCSTWLKRIADDSDARGSSRKSARKPTTRKSAATRIVAQLDAWIESLSHRGAGLTLALECLAWAYLVPGLSKLLLPGRVDELVEQLMAVSRDAAGVGLPRHPVEHQLLTGELPLLLSIVRPDHSHSEGWQTAAVASLAAGIDALLDGDGMPHARDLAIVRLLLACWTRCTAIGDAAGMDALPGDARLQYEWLVRQAIRLTRHDGSPILVADEAAYPADLFAVALENAGDRADMAMADCVLPRGKYLAKLAARSGNLIEAPEPSIYSGWAEVAVMRSGWKRPDEYFATTFNGPELHGELSVGKARLLAGQWETRLRVDDKPLSIDSEWGELCWHSDDDVDYLEIQQDWSHGWKLQRQILLARQDRFVLLADAVVGEAVGKIEYEVTLPLVDGIEFQPGEETTDGELHGQRVLATVLPLALSEWRCDSSRGTLTQQGRGLTLSQSIYGQRLYAPLFVDLVSRRAVRERTWRQLTVAERLRIQPPDVAVGYRVQIGREQWLFYRSLAPAGNRTVLGHNLSNEFLAAQFDGDGEVNSLVQIDTE
ncbi:MAG: hypothetical protein R3C99_22190 [Pirellulaceae bacterium]